MTRNGELVFRVGTGVPSYCFRSTSVSVIGATVLIAMTSGCVRLPHQSVSRLWDRVLWSAAEEVSESSESPTVSANVARTTPEADDAAPIPSAEQPAAVVANEAVASSTRKASDSQTLTPDPWAETTSSPPSRRIRELKEALLADADQKTAESPGLSGSQSLRLRVDGLLQRANELLRVGRLRDARRTAQLAAELSDAGALDFLPTEDRPNDVLREIEDRMHAARLSDTPRSADVAGATDDSANLMGLAAGSAAEPERHTVGKVVANGPFALADQTESEESPGSGSDDIPTMPVVLVPAKHAWNGAADERSLLTSVPWKEPGVDAGSAGAGWTDPHPPTIDAIAPLTTFRARPSVSPQAEAPLPQPPAGPWFTWSDGLALFLLATLLCGVGLALQIRRWRCG